MNMTKATLYTTYYRENIFSRFSSNSEVIALELLENLEEMIPRLDDRMLIADSS